MILEFIYAELFLDRFSEKVNKAIRDSNSNIDIITNPNLNCDIENRLRKNIFEEYHDYKKDCRD